MHFHKDVLYEMSHFEMKPTEFYNSQITLIRLRE